VAHDFNNLLMGISGQAELLLETSDQSRAQERTRQILSATKSAGDLTKKLLAFSQRQELAASVFDLNQVIQETVELFKRILPANVTVSVQLSSSACWVKTDRAQMEQTLFSLITNAQDAMPDGGQLLISTVDIIVGSQSFDQHGDIPDGAYVLLTITDTGCGIPEEIQEHIFEPFFTTKAKERGVGLGLSIVYGVVGQSGGHIRFTSAPCEGTTFSVYLPSLAQPQPRMSSSKPCPLRMSQSSCPRLGTVLVVDDEELIRTSVRAFLELNGLTVIDCDNASEALRIASELKDELALLVTDIVMHGMSGTELAATLTEQWAELPIIFMSGYAAKEGNHLQFNQARFLQKPFSCATLLRTVCERLPECLRMEKAKQ